MLACELVEHGNRVITTTTTRILPPSRAESPAIITAENEKALLYRAEDGLRKHRHITIAAGLSEQKLKGLSPERVDDIGRRELADVILIEADGARHCPLKAPNATEPVVPRTTTLVIAVVGLDGIGKPNSEEYVFRPECFARISGIKEGKIVTPEAVARAMVHPESCLRGAPKGAQVMIVLNKADSLEREEVGIQIARAILGQGRGEIGKILITRLIPAPGILGTFSAFA
jgi:probable selenium-dependent hydroxylase accessory protein YqeC